MTSIKLILRSSVREGRYAGSLSLRLIHDRRVKTLTLRGCRLYPEEWNRKTQEIIYPEDNPRRVMYLEKLEDKVREELEILNNHLTGLQKKGRYGLEDLLSLYCKQKDEGKLSGYAESLALRLEKQGQKRTARAYRTVVRGIIKYNNKNDIPLPQMNSYLIKGFENHLRDAGKLPNTISYYMRNLRAIYNKAVAEKRIIKPKENPFSGVYTNVAKTMKRTLSADEIQCLQDLNFGKLFEEKKSDSPGYRSIENLCRARQYFAFCFYARGMSFIDMVYLKKDNVRGGFIRYVRRKTGQQIEVKVTPEMQAIIDRFSQETAGSSYVFPIIRENGKPVYLQYETALRSQNYRLKKLATLAGINKRVSTHWARHSWASIGKQENLPIRVISECLGHTSEKTTLIYLNLLDNSLLDAANETVISAIARHPICRSPIYNL